MTSDPQSPSARVPANDRTAIIATTRIHEPWEIECDKGELSITDIDANPFQCIEFGGEVGSLLSPRG